jgi:hypothetical protein
MADDSSTSTAEAPTSDLIASAMSSRQAANALSAGKPSSILTVFEEVLHIRFC